MPLSSSLTDHQESGTLQSTTTFSTVSFGAAASDRIILVMVGGRTNGATAVASVTIAGSTASRVSGAAANSTGNIIGDAFYLAVPSGTSGAVVVAWTGGNIDRCAIAVYRLTGSKPTPDQGVNVNGTTDTLTLPSLTVPSDGAAFAFAIQRAGGTGTYVWTNTDSSGGDYLAHVTGGAGSSDISAARRTTAGTVAIASTDTQNFASDAITLGVLWSGLIGTPIARPPVPRNPLVYAAGAIARFDPKHLASKNTLISVVGGGNSFTNVMSGRTATLSAAHKNIIDAVLGSATDVNGNQASFTGLPTTTPPAFTVAGIFKLTAGGSYSALFQNLGGAYNNAILVVAQGGSSNPAVFINTNAITSTAVSLAVGVPYFFAVSATSGQSVRFFAKNLNTGVVQTDTIANANTFSAMDGGCLIGNDQFTQTFVGPIAALMYSTAPLSFQALHQWAQAPWEFWYPKQPPLRALTTAAGAAASGTLATTEAPDVAAFTATYVVSGTLATTEAQDTAAFTGNAVYSGTLATTEAQDVAAFTATYVVSGTLATTEAQDVAAFNATYVVSGTLATTEAQDVAAFTGDYIVSGVLATTEGQDVAAFTGSGVGASGTLATTEAQDVAAFTGNFVYLGTLATTEAQDVAAFTGNAVYSGTLTTTESPDTAAFAATFAITGVLAATEAPDVAAFAGNFVTSGTLAATEFPDIAAFIGTVAGLPTGPLITTEAPDILLISIDYTAPPQQTSPVPYPSLYDYGWYDHAPVVQR